MGLRQMTEDRIERNGDIGFPASATVHALFPPVSPAAEPVSPAAEPVSPAVEPGLDALERSVIALARHDRLASLAPPGPIERLFAWAFGLRTDGGRLADPRLEALRRAAVVTRHRHHLPDAVAAELRERGYAGARLRELERLALLD